MINCVFVTLPCGILGQVMVLDCIDSSSLPSSLLLPTIIDNLFRKFRRRTKTKIGNKSCFISFFVNDKTEEQ